MKEDVKGTVEEALLPGQVKIGDKIITFRKTPTTVYLDMQTKAQGGQGKMLLTKFTKLVLGRIKEDFKVDDFTPDEIMELIDEFDTFCNTKS